MSFKVFENEIPEVYSLANHAERILESNHIIALNHLKEIGRLIVEMILINKNAPDKNSDYST